MYENNPLLRHEHEPVTYTQEQLLELLKCSQDVLYFAENYCYIQTIDFGYILPKLREYQKKILKAYSHKKYRNNRRHCIVMAPRQSAKTVTSAIALVHYLIFNKDKNVGIVANKQDTAIEIVDKVRQIYEKLPLWMQPGIKDGGWNKKGLRLANDMRLLSSSSSGSGLRGYTIAVLYLDEFAFLAKNVAEQFMRAMFPTVESGTDSIIIITSTPQGLNHFSDIYTNAISQTGNSSYFPIRIYESEVPRSDGHEKFKKRIIDDHGILYWNQEYECVTGDTFITVRHKATGEILNIKITDLINTYINKK